MKVTSKKINGYTVELSVQENTKEMNKFRAKTLEGIKEKANIKGFRKGKNIPDEVIIEQYSEEAIQHYTLELALEHIYPKALKKADIKPVAQGSITKVNSYIPLDMIVEVEVMPEVEIDEKKLKKIKVETKKISVTKKEVTEEMNRIESQFTTFEVDEKRAIKKGDKVKINALGYTKKGGDEIPETNVQKHDLVIGSNSFIPGFEEELVGHKLGEEVGFDITFPKDYHSDDFKGKKVHFVVNILEISKSVKPEWTEDFTEKLRGKKMTKEEFEATIKEEIKEYKEGQARQDYEDKLLDELIKITKIEIGPKLIEQETQAVFNGEKGRMEQQGMQMEMYLAHMKMTEEDFKEKQIKPIATRRVQAQFILSDLKNHVSVEVTDTEVQAEINTILMKYQDPKVLKKLKELYVSGTPHFEEIRTKLEYKKIIDSFLQAKTK